MTTLIAEASLPADWYDGASQVLFLFRVIIGVTLAAHGYNKFFGGGKIAGTARWFDSMGMKPNGTVHAYLAASTEIGSGVLMALGLLTPLAGADDSSSGHVCRRPGAGGGGGVGAGVVAAARPRAESANAMIGAWILLEILGPSALIALSIVLWR